VSRTRALSPQTQAVLRALGGQPATWRYGYELGEQVGLKSGSLYPILMRLADRDLLHTNWEPNPPTGRPPRHLYRLSPLGLAFVAEVDLAMLAVSSRPRRAQQSLGGAR
jgi:PadR family transcriptional regulator PadR